MCIHKLCLFNRCGAVRSAASRLPCQCGLACRESGQTIGAPQQIPWRETSRDSERLNGQVKRQRPIAERTTWNSRRQCIYNDGNGMSDDRRIRVGKHNEFMADTFDLLTANIARGGTSGRESARVIISRPVIELFDARVVTPTYKRARARQDRRRVVDLARERDCVRDRSARR